MDQKISTQSQSNSIDEYFFRQHLVLVFIFSFLFGILVSSLVFISPILAILFILVAGAILLAEKIWHRKIEKEILLVTLALISFSFGVLRYDIKDFHEPDPLFVAQVGKQVEIAGIVVGEPELRDNNTRFTVRTENEKILVYADLYSPARYGDNVQIIGKLQEPGVIDDGVGRPFDYARYLSKDDIYFTISFAQVKVLSSGHGSPIKATLIRIKENYVSKVREILPEPESGLLSGFTIAGKGALPQEIVDEFRRAGVIHIVVLSGYHVALITMFLLWLFSLISMRLRQGLKFARIATIVGLAIFVLTAGASASILRAAIMVLVALGGKFINRPYSAPRALLAAAFLLVFLNPKILVFDASFQLSFLATLGIIYLSPIVDVYLAKLLSPKWGLRNLLSITIAAQLAVSPFLLYAMGNVSLIALLSNVLILPAVPFAMIIGFISALVAYISPLIALPFSYIAHLLLAWILGVSNILGNLPLASIAVPIVPVWLVALMYLSIIIFVWRRS